jgi:hypothetical protein
MIVNRMNLGACALILFVLESGCVTARRANTTHGASPSTGDQANPSASGAQAAQRAAGSPAKAQHLTGVNVPNWWQTDALQSGDVMGTM